MFFENSFLACIIHTFFSERSSSLNSPRFCFSSFRKLPLPLCTGAQPFRNFRYLCALMRGTFGNFRYLCAPVRGVFGNFRYHETVFNNQ
jgi:hypothetical protein